MLKEALLSPSRTIDAIVEVAPTGAGCVGTTSFRREAPGMEGSVVLDTDSGRAKYDLEGFDILS